MSHRKEIVRAGQPFMFLAVMTLALASLFHHGCASRSPEERVAERGQQAYEIVSHTVWVRHPDIKGMCFGISWFYEKGYGFTIECKYVEHLLVNPTPPGLPPEKDDAR